MCRKEDESETERAQRIIPEDDARGAVLLHPTGLIPLPISRVCWGWCLDRGGVLVMTIQPVLGLPEPLRQALAEAVQLWWSRNRGQSHQEGGATESVRRRQRQRSKPSLPRAAAPGPQRTMQLAAPGWAAWAGAPQRTLEGDDDDGEWSCWAAVQRMARRCLLLLRWRRVAGRAGQAGRRAAARGSSSSRRGDGDPCCWACCC